MFSSLIVSVTKDFQLVTQRTCICNVLLHKFGEIWCFGAVETAGARWQCSCLGCGFVASSTAATVIMRWKVVLGFGWSVGCDDLWVLVVLGFDWVGFTAILVGFVVGLWGGCLVGLCLSVTLWCVCSGFVMDFWWVWGGFIWVFFCGFTMSSFMGFDWFSVSR